MTLQDVKALLTQASAAIDTVVDSSAQFTQADMDAAVNPLKSQVSNMQQTISGIPDQISQAVTAAVETFKAQELIDEEDVEKAQAVLHAKLQPAVQASQAPSGNQPSVGA